MTDGPETRRLELILRKPRLGWWPRPTVVFGGRGHPAQWGAGTWQIPVDVPTLVQVYLFNRLWRFGAAEIVVMPHDAARLSYSPPGAALLGGQLRGARLVVASVVGDDRD